MLSVTGSRAGGAFPSYRWLSAARAAGQLGLTLRELYRLIDTGRLPAYRIAGELKLMAEDVDRWRTRDHDSRSGGNRPPDHPDPRAQHPGAVASLGPMCRNITTLRGLDPQATTEEIEAAARQYVRKVSGVQKTSPATEAPFELAVRRIAEATTELLAVLPERRQPPPTLPPLRRIAART